MVFLIPCVPNKMVWTLFFLGENLLFKFILTWCGVIIPVAASNMQLSKIKMLLSTLKWKLYNEIKGKQGTKLEHLGHLLKLLNFVP